MYTVPADFVTCTVQSTMYVAHCKECTLYTVHLILQTVICTYWSSHLNSTLNIHCAHCGLYAAGFKKTLYTVHWTLYTVQRTIYNLHYLLARSSELDELSPLTLAATPFLTKYLCFFLTIFTKQKTSFLQQGKLSYPRPQPYASHKWISYALKHPCTIFSTWICS